MLDYVLAYNHVSILCDRTSAINLTKNPIQHSRIKHKEIRYHFIRDYVQKRDIVLEYVDTKHQMVDIFTKPSAKEQFSTIQREISMQLCG